jgi:hypothetical protein
MNIAKPNLAGSVCLMPPRYDKTFRFQNGDLAWRDYDNQLIAGIVLDVDLLKNEFSVLWSNRHEITGRYSLDESWLFSRVYRHDVIVHLNSTGMYPQHVV